MRNRSRDREVLNSSRDQEAIKASVVHNSKIKDKDPHLKTSSSCDKLNKIDRDKVHRDKVKIHRDKVKISKDKAKALPDRAARARQDKEARARRDKAVKVHKDQELDRQLRIINKCNKEAQSAGIDQFKDTIIHLRINVSIK